MLQFESDAVSLKPVKNQILYTVFFQLNNTVQHVVSGTK